jgi:hypothetical protein
MAKYHDEYKIDKFISAWKKEVGLIKKRVLRAA